MLRFWVQELGFFFLAKAEVEKWPILGNLAKGGGTLFIKRGSGDSARIREQIAAFLKQDIPVLFFPEATTTDGRQVKKITWSITWGCH